MIYRLPFPAIQRLLLSFTLLLLVGFTSAWAQVQPVFNLAVGVGTTTSTLPNSPVHTSHVNKTAVDGAGNIYVVGYFHETVSFGNITLTSAGNSDLFLAKLDSTGQYLWAVRAGSTATDAAVGLALTPEGAVYITGYFRYSATFGAITLTGPGTSEGFIAKYDPQGACAWAHLTAGHEGYGEALAVDYNGDVVLHGTFYGPTATFGSTTLLNYGPPTSLVYTAFVAKISAAGTWHWAVRAGTKSGGITVDGFGNAYVAGSYGGTLTFGSVTLTSVAGGQDMFVGKLDSAGTWLWAAGGGGASYDYGSGIGVDYAGNVFVAGGFNPPSATFGTITLTNRGGGNFDAFVAKLDANGTYLWAVGAGGTDNDYANSLAVDDDGSLLVVGGYQDYGPGATFGSIVMPNTGRRYGQLFAGKLSGAGTWEWVTTTQGTYTDYVRDVVLDYKGGIYLAGSFTSPIINFGATTLLRNPRANTGFVARLGGSRLATVALVAPAQGGPGSRVTLRGARFTGATAVFFNGVPASSFTVTSPTTIQATVPTGATTGPISVQTSAGAGPNGSVFQVGVLAATAGSGPLAVTCWPNPVSAGTSLSLTLPTATSGSQPTEVTLYTLHGQLIVRRQFTAPKAALLLDNIQSGIYMLHVRTAQQERARYAVVVE
jgi:hypothetical protein